MSKAYILLVMGIWLAVLPYLGFTYVWKGILTTVSGLGMIFVSIIFYREYKKKETRTEVVFDNFSENKPSN